VPFRGGNRGVPLQVARVAKPQKVHQKRELVHPIKGKAQKEKRKLRRAEEEEAAYMAKS